MSRIVTAVGSLALAMTLVGCGSGEVTGLELPVIPDNGDDFVAAQEAMLTVGCGIAGCHAAIVGNFQVSGEAGNRPDEYLLSKAIIDLEDPEDSLLLRVSLVGDPAAAQHPVCYAGTQGCAWRIISAWIRGGTFDEDQDGNPLVPASEVAESCTPTPNACFTGGD